MAVDKNKALETALTQIEKQFGKGAVMRLGENKHMNIEHISTGSLSLDIALGMLHLLMLSMHSIRHMRRLSVLMLIHSSFHSRTQVKTLLKLQRHLSEAVRLMLS